MKNCSIIQISRNNKQIVIYVKDGDWSGVPSLDFIADVEVREEPKEEELIQPNFFRWLMDRIQI